MIRIHGARIENDLHEMSHMGSYITFVLPISFSCELEGTASNPQEIVDLIDDGRIITLLRDIERSEYEWEIRTLHEEIERVSKVKDELYKNIKSVKEALGIYDEEYDCE